MKKYKQPKIKEIYNDMREFVLLHICYECPFNRKDTPKGYDCVNFEELTGDDCPIWMELRECYV